ncbi:unnamed protein product [Absidia cylindrospora]
MVDNAHTIPFITDHPALTHLDLYETYCSDATLDVISTALPKLTHLGLNNNHSMTADRLRQCVLACSSLTYLGLRGSSISRYDFREAGEQCLDEGSVSSVVRYDDILFLDHPTISKIRLGS